MLFSSEQVSCGHPDKVCDQIADALLDAYLAKDKDSRVAVEGLIKNDHIIVAGEVTSKGTVDVNGEIHRVLHDIGIDGDYRIQNLIDGQSPDIALGVDVGGAGDQGMMFGFATDETPELLPLPYMIATKALMNLRALRHPMLRPDAKAQVTIDDAGGKSRIDTFLISTQHCEEIPLSGVREIVSQVMADTAVTCGMNTDFRVLVNPTGRFVIGGSFGDCGVTGRKIVADTYGGYSRHGGGAFSGKDYTKVDRSASYMARYLAKWALLSYGFQTCEIQLAYAIGLREPLSVNVRADGRPKDRVSKKILSNFDLTPKGIIDFLGLRDIKYYETARYGHFTNQAMPWERIQK